MGTDPGARKVDVDRQREYFTALQASYSREAGRPVSAYEVGLAVEAERRGEDWRRAIVHKKDLKTRLLKTSAFVVLFPLVFLSPRLSTRLLDWVDRKLTYDRLRP